MPKIIENLKENILETAGVLLAEKGFAAFSIRCLSKELHIAPATIYNYYDNKEQIIGEVITQRWRGLLAEIEATTKNTPTAIDALQKTSIALREFMQPMLSYWAKDEESAKSQTQRQHIMEKKQYILDTLTEIVCLLLEKHGMTAKKAQEISPIVTKVLVLSSHDHTLDFKKMVLAIQQLDI